MSGDLARRIVEMVQSAADTIDPSTYCHLSVTASTPHNGVTQYSFEACLCRRTDGTVLVFPVFNGVVSNAGVQLPGCAAPQAAGGEFFGAVRAELERAAPPAQQGAFGHHGSQRVEVEVLLQHVDGVEGRLLVGERCCLLSAIVPLERNSSSGHSRGSAADGAMRQLDNCVWTVANLVPWE